MQNNDLPEVLIKRKDLEVIFNYESSINNLLGRKVIPLHKTPLLANLCGHLIGDGGLQLRKNNEGHVRFYGTKEKLLKISDDYSIIFNKKVSLRKRQRSFDKGYMLAFADTRVVKLLSWLGVPTGDKVLKEFQVPEWIMNSNKEIKKKFLQALCDDELEGLYKEKGKPNTWHGLKFKMSKAEQHLTGHIHFLNQLRNLFLEFGIKTSEVKIAWNQPYDRKDGNITYPAYFRIQNKKSNRLKFQQEISFFRDERKSMQLAESLA